MSRPRKSVAELKLHGNFREDRHADREDIESIVGGIPEKPDDLDSFENSFWDLVMSQYGEAGPVRMIDGPALLTCCQLWSLWQRSVRAYKSDMGDRDLRLAVSQHYKDWDRAASKLGLTPRDRRSVPLPKSAKSSGVKRRNRA